MFSLKWKRFHRNGKPLIATQSGQQYNSFMYLGRNYQNIYQIKGIILPLCLMECRKNSLCYLNRFHWFSTSTFKRFGLWRLPIVLWCMTNWLHTLLKYVEFINHQGVFDMCMCIVLFRVMLPMLRSLYKNFSLFFLIFLSSHRKHFVQWYVKKLIVSICF